MQTLVKEKLILDSYLTEMDIPRANLSEENIFGAFTDLVFIESHFWAVPI